MEPLDQNAFPVGPNVRRGAYWFTALMLAVASYLGAREIIDSIDMAFITGIATVIAGMAGVNTPQQDK